MNAVRVVKVWILTVYFKDVKKLTWERGTINVTNVPNAWTTTGILAHRKQPILKLNPMNQKNLLIPIVLIPVYTCNKELTWKVSPMNKKHVVNLHYIKFIDYMVDFKRKNDASV